MWTVLFQSPGQVYDGLDQPGRIGVLVHFPDGQPALPGFCKGVIVQIHIRIAGQLLVDLGQIQKFPMEVLGKGGGLELPLGHLLIIIVPGHPAPENQEKAEDQDGDNQKIR